MAVTDAPEAEPAPTPPGERRTRILIVVGASLTFAGIALAVTNDDFARWLVVGGLVLLAVGLHRFGRLGSDGAVG